MAPTNSTAAPLARLPLELEAREAANLPFLKTGGLMAERVASHDWAATSLGEISSWPQSLRSTVDLLLGSRFPMFVAWGPELRMIYNDAYGEILSAKHPQALGQRFQDVWAEIWTDITPLVTRALSGESFYMENLPLMMRRTGHDEQTWFTFSYSPVRDESGQVGGMYCACMETTATVLAEHRQRAEEQRLQRLFQQAPGFMAVMRGPEHVFELVNESFVQLTGQRQPIGRKLADVMPEVVEQGLVRLLDEVVASGEAYVGRSVRLLLNRQPGRAAEIYVDFVYQPLVEANGSVSGVFLQGQDVTERHRAEEALQLFLNTMPAMAWIAAPDGRLERVNAQWTSYTGQSMEEALGHGWVSALHPDDKKLPWDLWRQARSNNQKWQGEYRLKGKDGEYRWFLTRAVAQLDGPGRVMRWFGTTTDIEEAKRSQQALSDADRQKDEYLATLAHELRNPLAPIRMAAHVLSSPNLPPETLVRTTDVIKRQVNHMARLLDDLLDVARITKGQLPLKKDDVPLDQLVAAAVETARPIIEAKQHRLSLDLPPQQLVLEVDPLRMAQVLSNLLNNAAKYTDPGGEILLKAWCHFPNTEHAGTDAQGDCTIEVIDNGIGLAPDAQHKIFRMFAQEASAVDRAEGGLGIGLALVRGLVELHGGSVEAFSDGPGRGSRFSLRLPLSVRAPSV